MKLIDALALCEDGQMFLTIDGDTVEGALWFDYGDGTTSLACVGIPL